jgi:hypothetical protein
MREETVQDTRQKTTQMEERRGEGRGDDNVSTDATSCRGGSKQEGSPMTLPVCSPSLSRS